MGRMARFRDRLYLLLYLSAALLPLSFVVTLVGFMALWLPEFWRVAAAVCGGIGLMVAVLVGRKSRSAPVAFVSFLICGVGTFLTLLAALYPLRALALFVLRAIPNVSLHWKLMAQLRPTPQLDLFDLITGAVLASFSLLVMIREAFHLHRRLRQLKNLPTAKTRSAAVGLAEFQGVYRVPDGCEPPHAGPAVKKTPFLLEDDTGRILVDPREAGRGLRRAASWWVIGELQHMEVPLNLGDGMPLYVIGTVAINRDAPPDARGPDALVVRPAPRAPDIKRFFPESGDDEQQIQLIGDALDKDTWQDIFFVTTGTEKDARRLFVRRARNILLSGGIAALLCTALALSALWRLYPPASTTPPEARALAADLQPEVRRLVRYLHHPEVGYRRYAVQQFPADFVKSQFEAALPMLMAMLEDRDHDLRLFAIGALAKVGLNEEHAQYRARIRGAAADSDERVRNIALGLLPDIGVPAEQALPLLRAALRRDNLWAESKTAAQTAHRYGAAGLELIPEMCMLLDHGTWWLAAPIATALAAFGEPALPHLRRLLPDVDPTVRGRMMGAISEILKEPDRFVDFCRELLGNDGDHHHSLQRARAGPDPRARIPRQRL